MQRIRIIVAALLIASGGAAFAPSSLVGVAQAADKEVGPEERYELGLRYMKRGYYTKALEQFQRVRNYHRDDPVSVKAELAIADLYFKKGEYEQAKLAYEDFARLHPRHENLDYVIWRTGQCLFKRASKVAGRDQTTTRQAVSVWTGFRERFPESSHHAEVDDLLGKGRNRLARKELAIAKFYAKREAWLAARKRAEGLLKRYPDSEHVPEALALAAEAYHASGLTDEARSVREKLATNYPASPYVKVADRALAKPAGEPPTEDTFIRPYRLPSGSGAPATGQP